MHDCGRLSRHFWLMRGMARTIGISLSAARRDGRLSTAGYTHAIATCCACGQSARCTDWMGRQGAGATALPDYCAVKPMIEALRS